MNHTTLTVDEELVRQAKSRHINMSEALRDYLRILIDRDNMDVDGIDIQLERNKLEKLTKDHANIQIELNSCKANIEKWENLREKKQEEELKKEKELIEAKSKCINCGNFIQHKSHQFKGGNVCHGCFMSSDGKQIKKWNELKE